MTPHRSLVLSLVTKLHLGTRLRFRNGRIHFARQGSFWHRKAIASALATLAMLLLSTGIARACSVPVYRYALDRWPADPYELDVSTTDAKDPGVARFLRNFTDNTPLNLAPVRLKEAGPSHLAFPHAAPEAAPAWTGALEAAAIPSITDSPVRTELTHRILAGETGVWVLVESGQHDADEQVATALDKRLRYLEQAAEVPPIDPDDPTSELGPGPPLMVKFSVLRVRHDDPAEQAFLRMLAGPKHDTPPSTGPWLALVFGRGRVLGAWPSEGFGSEQIDEASLFLLGACSCQVKRMNPGWDLLLNANWDEALQAIGFPQPGQPPPVATPILAKASINEGTSGSTATDPIEKVAAAAPNGQIVGGPNPALPAPSKVETVTITAAASGPAAAAPRGTGIPAAAAALALLVAGSAMAWRAFQRHP